MVFFLVGFYFALIIDNNFTRKLARFIETAQNAEPSLMKSETTERKLRADYCCNDRIHVHVRECVCVCLYATAYIFHVMIIVRHQIGADEIETMAARHQ